VKQSVSFHVGLEGYRRATAMLVVCVEFRCRAVGPLSGGCRC
jgi:hypothetical protein